MVTRIGHDYEFPRWKLSESRPRVHLSKSVSLFSNRITSKTIFIRETVLNLFSSFSGKISERRLHDSLG